MTAPASSSPATSGYRSGRILALSGVMLLGLSMGFFIVHGLRPPEVTLSSSGPAEFSIKVRNRDSVTARRTGTIKLTRRTLDGRTEVYASIHYYPPRKLAPVTRFGVNKREWFNECGTKVHFLDYPKVSPTGTRIEQRYQNPCSGNYGLLRLIALDGQDALMLDVYRTGRSADNSELSAASWDPIRSQMDDLQSRLRPPVA